MSRNHNRHDLEMIITQGDGLDANYRGRMHLALFSDEDVMMVQLRNLYEEMRERGNRDHLMAPEFREVFTELFNREVAPEDRIDPSLWASSR